jgi:ACS family tartrate transporter-like MFS transporter
MLLPPAVGVAGQLFAGWSSDRTRERRLHVAVPLFAATAGFLGVIASRGHLGLTLACLAVTVGGTKAYQPAFWALPSLFLAETAAAGSIGFINSFGNLGGGGIGAPVMGYLKEHTGSYVVGLSILAGSTFVAATIVLLLGLGRRAPPSHPAV